jgi:hypothetical protein
MTAAGALRKGVWAALSGDAALGALLGGVKVFDGAPAGTALPYVTFGRSASFDWSTATEKGTEVLFTLHAWARGAGRRGVEAIVERVAGRLEAGLDALDGHRLVNLRLEAVETNFEEDAAVQHGALRFRAVLEAVG